MLLYLYMATTAGGLVSGKLIMASARRVRVTCVPAPFDLFTPVIRNSYLSMKMKMMMMIIIIFITRFSCQRQGAPADKLQ